MGDYGQEVRSPWSTNRGSPDDVARRGEIQQAAIYGPRSDAGHLGPHTAGKGWTPLGLRSDQAAEPSAPPPVAPIEGPTPVVGSTLGVMQDRGRRG
jgi:hypothetical protein